MILLYLHGGASQLETYDLKPKAPSEYRSVFDPIPTNVPGMDICEHFPLQAQLAIGQFLARYAARNIARVEDHNFFVGTGAASGINGTVKGLTYSTIDNSKVTQMASTKTKYSDATLANLRTLRSVPDAAALRTGQYFMHPSFEQHLSGLNTAGDRPYNANGVQGATLDGFKINFVDIMPAYSTSANTSKVFILFGDPSYQ